MARQRTLNSVTSESLFETLSTWFRNQQDIIQTVLRIFKWIFDSNCYYIISSVELRGRSLGLFHKCIIVPKNYMNSKSRFTWLLIWVWFLENFLVGPLWPVRIRCIKAPNLGGFHTRWLNALKRLIFIIKHNSQY